MRNWSFTLLYLKRTGPQCHNLSMSGKNINENVSLYRFPTFLGFLTFSFFCMRGSFQTVTENCIFLCFHGDQTASGALNSSFTTFKLFGNLDAHPSCIFTNNCLLLVRITRFVIVA